MENKKPVKKIRKSKYTFKVFAADTFTYVLEITNMKWSWKIPEEVAREVDHVFKSDFGDAVVCYMERHKGTGIFLENQNNMIDNLEDLLEYTTDVLADLLKDDCFLMDVIRVFAFFCDLIANFYKDGKDDLIEPTLECLDEFHKTYLKQPLSIMGEFSSLLRFAEQYVEYNSKDHELKAELLESTAVGSNSMVIDKEGNFNTDANDNKFDIAVAIQESILESLQCRNQEDWAADHNGSNTANSDIKAILKRALKNEFSSPHSEHCKSEFCRTSDQKSPEEKRLKTDDFKRRLSFSD